MTDDVCWPSELLEVWQEIFPCVRCQGDAALKTKILWDRCVPLKTIGILPSGARSVVVLQVSGEGSRLASGD